jgi:hypothetical protein
VRTRLLLPLAVISLVFSASGCTWIIRVSLGGGGAEPDAASANPVLSADGRLVAFESDATNLVDDDTNGATDIFVRDARTGTTERVSVSSAGDEGDDASTNASISEDGRFVAFQSAATNLDAADTAGDQDVFVHDRSTHSTVRIADGVAPDLSETGRYVVYEVEGVVVSSTPAHPLLPACDVYDRDASTTTRIALQTASGQPWEGCAQPSISDNGRVVAFVGYHGGVVANDHAKVFWKNFDTNQVDRTLATIGYSYEPALAGNAGAVAYTYHDSFSGSADEDIGWERLSDHGFYKASSGVLNSPRRPSMCDNARFVGLETRVAGADSPIGIFMVDIVTGQTNEDLDATNTTMGNADSHTVDIADDCNYVAYSSSATNLVPNTPSDAAPGIYVRAYPTVWFVPDGTLSAPITRGATTTFRIRGLWRLPLKASVSGAGVTVNSVVSDGLGAAKVTVTVAANAALGRRNLNAWNEGTGPGTNAGSLYVCEDCVTVVAP